MHYISMKTGYLQNLMIAAVVCLWVIRYIWLLFWFQIEKHIHAYPCVFAGVASGRIFFWRHDYILHMNALAYLLLPQVELVYTRSTVIHHGPLNRLALACSPQYSYQYQLIPHILAADAIPECWPNKIHVNKFRIYAAVRLLTALNRWVRTYFQ